MDDLEIEENEDGTYNVRGDFPARIVLRNSKRVIADEIELLGEEISVRVYGGFDLIGCEGVADFGTGDFLISQCSNAKLNDVVIEK